MKTRYWLILLFFLGVGCRDKYELPLRESDKALLVVEGFLNAGQGPTSLTLSRTVNLDARVKFVPELRATLTVEDKSGNAFLLRENSNGNYSHPQLPLTIGQEYRLRIRSGAREYLSDYVVARETPPIDSLSWRKENEGLTIYANAHDASNKTRYYKWNFDETWEIHSYYTSAYQWLGGVTIIPATQTINYVCWKYGQSTNLLIGSTAQLQKDVLSEAPLLLIPTGSEKLGVRYSILARQQALDKQGYEYFQLMKRNTESIGSIFDPQPSELKGNIHCVSNPEEGVIGYLTASTLVEKRLFITAQEADWIYRQSCPSITVKNHPDSLRLWLPGYLPFGAETFGTTVVSYDMAPDNCVDCRTRGGNTTKPAYW